MTLQVALIVFLSHIGSFVPADSAIVGITDRIFCGVASKHTVTSEQSTFMMDLHQIGIMLRHATSRSLCLIDEFGKGTLTTDGIGLLCGTLRHFASYNNPPKVLVCTHLSEIFNEYHLPKSESLRFYTMSILKPNNSITKGVDDIIFLYRLVPGRAFSSYGLHCAKLAGVSYEILERATYILRVNNDKKPFDRFRNESMSSKDGQYKEIMERFVAFDFTHGDVKNFLNNIFLSKSQLE